MEERNFSLDFLKIVATIGIIFHHWQQVTGAYFENHINFYNGRFYWGVSGRAILCTLWFFLLEVYTENQ